MRILILHSRYLSGSLSGENRVVEDEATLLRESGHDVEVLAPSAEGMSRVALGARSLASSGIAAAVRSRVHSEGIEVVHCHNLYPTLGPGVVVAAAKGGAAVVMSLHNYRSMCIAGTFFRDGRVCEDCLGRTPWPGVVHACYRASRSQSAALAASLVVGRARRALSSVHRFLALSEFVRDKHIEAGLPAERIIVKPNAVPAQAQRAGPGKYFLVLSRLSVEKGVAQLVGSWDKGVGELRIAGDGPERTEIERLAVAGDVRLEGSVAPTEIPALLVGARAVLVPSMCFEGQPRVVLEAYAAGVPVIASRIGGLAELVIDGETGMTVAPGDAKGWRMAAAKLGDDRLSVRLGEGAHALWRTRFSPERGREMLEKAYLAALDERDRSQKMKRAKGTSSSAS